MSSNRSHTSGLLSLLRTCSSCSWLVADGRRGRRAGLAVLHSLLVAGIATPVERCAPMARGLGKLSQPQLPARQGSTRCPAAGGGVCLGQQQGTWPAPGATSAGGGHSRRSRRCAATPRGAVLAAPWLRGSPWAGVVVAAVRAGAARAFSTSVWLGRVPCMLARTRGGRQAMRRALRRPCCARRREALGPCGRQLLGPPKSPPPGFRAVLQRRATLGCLIWCLAGEGMGEARRGGHGRVHRDLAQEVQRARATKIAFC